MRIINNNYVTTLTSQSTINRGGNPRASLIIFKALLLVLIASQCELVTEVGFVPRAVDQAATLGAISD